MARHIRTGDSVEVISGKYRGQQGKVLEILTEKNRVRLEGVGVIKKHVKPGRDPKVPQGGIIEDNPTVHVSNVLPLDPTSGKATRVGFKVLEDGRKVRYFKSNGEVVDV